MANKTAAEQQLEYLKKLKEQLEEGKAAPKGMGRKEPGFEGNAPQPGLSVSLKSKRQKASSPTLPMSEEAWRRLRDLGIKKGLFKKNKELGDWAVELLLSIPYGLKDLSASSRQELFAKIRDWSDPRGLG